MDAMRALKNAARFKVLKSLDIGFYLKSHRTKVIKYALTLKIGVLEQGAKHPFIIKII
ncbi:MAG: hypothetical protein DHS20C18_04120 [Saprospiraceae bacterium]|nr:MAG: hypothetical protein DHS20C18_04120 [Saprospiraceae bacterium]